MQLMVQGDKWEMYIPMELAYGPSGRPPKIPPAATLIFIMEIVKIKGATVPKQITFPVWTAEQEALWLEKDEAACQKWKEAKVSQWEGGDAKLKESYPTREDLDKWVDATCKNSKVVLRFRMCAFEHDVSWICACTLLSPGMIERGERCHCACPWSSLTSACVAALQDKSLWKRTHAKKKD